MQNSVKSASAPRPHPATDPRRVREAREVAGINVRPRACDCGHGAPRRDRRAMAFVLPRKTPRHFRLLEGRERSRRARRAGRRAEDDRSSPGRILCFLRGSRHRLAPVPRGTSRLRPTTNSRTQPIEGGSDIWVGHNRHQAAWRSPTGWMARKATWIRFQPLIATISKVSITRSSSVNCSCSAR